MIGNLYLWGNIEPYVISYYHNKGDVQAVHHNGILIIPLSFTIQAFFNVLGSYLQKRWNPKTILALGALISVVSVLVASRMQTWALFVVFYGGVFPIGVGLLYWTPIICAWEYFPERKGLISGLVIGAFGFGAFLFGFITTAIVNPEDLSIDKGDPGNAFFPK